MGREFKEDKNIYEKYEKLREENYRKRCYRHF